jgi:hypothetical protein
LLTRAAPYQSSAGDFVGAQCREFSTRHRGRIVGDDQRTNLANTNPGRTWTASEVVNGHLPTALDGVSVTLDGKPAFVYYISPTQINVQASSDATLGAVT